MRQVGAAVVFFSIVVILSFAGCETTERSFREMTLDDMYPILSPDQYDELKSIESDEGIRRYVGEFWRDCDAASGLDTCEACGVSSSAGVCQPTFS